MRIYQMTATFGKLERQTLTLKPGLNVITAPNEWGKSTWCAFLLAMLYGLDTRTKTTKTNLADKERYAPWTGSPMSGRIDLNWRGRDITIERSTRRRVPMGEFRAYETESGLSVPELTAANCGQLLLGVEQSVYRRAGFIRHADLPVTQDDALRRRLNALVTTGDESGAADDLAEKLRNLRNRCRYNRTGLLPQAEAERDALEAKIAELDNLHTQSGQLKQRLEEVLRMLTLLENHRRSMDYAKAQEDAARVARARALRDETARELTRWEEACAQLPPQEEVQQKVRDLCQLRQLLTLAVEAEKTLPEQPEEPRLEPPFAGMTKEEAETMVQRDIADYYTITGTKMPGLLIFMGLLGLIVAGGLVYLTAYLYAGVAGGAALLSLLWGIVEKISLKKKAGALVEKYGTGNEKHWAQPLREYTRELELYTARYQEYAKQRRDMETRMKLLNSRKAALCGEEALDAVLDDWQKAARCWNALLTARKDARQASGHYETLAAMVKTVEKPTMPDEMTQSEEETTRLIAQCSAEQQRLQNRLGHYQGRMESLGDRETLEAERDRQLRRIAKLEDTYAALTIAQETLAQARAELQRRFAPRITRQAQGLLSRMTGGRYQSVTMDQEFALQSRAGEENVLHDSLWRSDGTVDQLYLALRLAVAQELTPNAPLILDDALVRFDDQRLAAAMGILKELAEERQIICFTCQSREAEV